MRQLIPGLGSSYIHYQYDLISGNMLSIAYDSGRVDQFFHRYRYDSDNRLLEVLTSRDGVIWESDSRYRYYAHGPLARTEYGQDSIQGTDYIYALDGHRLESLREGAAGDEVERGHLPHQESAYCTSVEVENRTALLPESEPPLLSSTPSTPAAPPVDSGHF